MKSFVIIQMLALGLGACASSMPPPSEKLASAESAARSAREVGAENEPQAALHLKMANDQIEQARAAMRAGNNEEAARWLTRASSDAELALELAKESTTRVHANEALAKVRAARDGS